MTSYMTLSGASFWVDTDFQIMMKTKLLENDKKEVFTDNESHIIWTQETQRKLLEIKM